MGPFDIDKNYIGFEKLPWSVAGYHSNPSKDIDLLITYFRDNMGNPFKVLHIYNHKLPNLSKWDFWHWYNIKDEDKTILAQGTICNLRWAYHPSLLEEDSFEAYIPYFMLHGCKYVLSHDSSATVSPDGMDPAYDDSEWEIKTLHEFISPDVSFLKKPSYISG